MDLKNKVVLITGGGTGLGRVTSLAMAREGAHLAIGYSRSKAEARSTVEELVALGARAIAVQADVADFAQVKAMVAQVMDEYGRIDVLVNNAGVMPLGDFLTEDDATSRTTLEVNVGGLINGMRLVMPHMIERGRGHVVNVASMAGKLVVPGMAVYNASKFAAVGLSAAVRHEYRDTGVSVSAVLPSAVRTRLASGVRLGRGLPTVEPESVAAAIVSSVANRRAEITVPRYLAGWNLLDAMTPNAVMTLARRAIGDRRALSSVAHDVRRDYVNALEAQVRQRR